jgi:hypothetical protein
VVHNHIINRRSSFLLCVCELRAGNFFSDLKFLSSRQNHGDD